MKTKTVTMKKATASFSTAAQHESAVTLSCPPWEKLDDTQASEPKEKVAGTIEDQRRGPRHLGPYSRNRKRN
jgi:hypothetical protein